jgi:hypothetical protein
MMKAESADAIAPGEPRLSVENIRIGEVIKAQISRQARLQVTNEAWYRFGDVGPFRETFPPPGVILWDRMELRQIESDQPNIGIPRRQHGGGVRLVEQTRLHAGLKLF